jgi:hypothetical protein
MRASIPGLAAEIDMELETFQKAFQEISAKGMAAHDKSTCFLWLPNFLKYNPPESPNVVKAWPQALELLPECEMKSGLCKTLRTITEGLSKAFREAYREAFREAMPNQEQEQQQEQQQQNRVPRLPGAQPMVPEFEGAQRRQSTYDSLPALEVSRASESAWHRICDGLEHELNRHAFSTWIAPLRNRVLGASEKILYVAIPTVGFKHVAVKYGALMRNIIEQHGLAIERIQFVHCVSAPSTAERSNPLLGEDLRAARRIV